MTAFSNVLKLRFSYCSAQISLDLFHTRKTKRERPSARTGEGEASAVECSGNYVKLRARSSHSHNVETLWHIVLIMGKPDLHRYLHRYCTGWPADRSVGRAIIRVVR